MSLKKNNVSQWNENVEDFYFAYFKIYVVCNVRNNHIVYDIWRNWEKKSPKRLINFEFNNQLEFIPEKILNWIVYKIELNEE